MKKTVIRVFEKVEASPLDILNNFRKVLLSIGCWKEEMGGKFENPKWHASDAGIQWDWNYVGAHDPMPSKFVGLSIQATAQPDLLNTKPFEGGIICTLVLKFADQGSKFDGNAYAAIHEIALLLFHEFKTRPVILLMDESKKKFPPGDTWEPVELSIYKKMLNPWNFDYAILPRSLDEVYETIKETHMVKKHENYIESWRMNTWKKDVLIKTYTL